MDAPWRIELLGGLRAIRGEQIVSRFRTRKTGVLLAYIAFYRPRSHDRGELIELLWPECDLEAGRNRLAVALSSLRRQLESPGVPAGAVLITDRATICLDRATTTTDVADFEAALQAAARAVSAGERVRWLTEAIDRYTGELLPGCCESWVVPERLRLANEFQEALRELIGHLELEGHLSRAIALARRAVAADPLLEEAHRHLIRLLGAAGQRDAVLAQYAELERLLAADLGAAPDETTRVLLTTLVAETEPRRAPAPSPAPRSPGEVAVLLVEITGDDAAAERSDPASTERRERLRGLLLSILRGHGGEEVSQARVLSVARFRQVGEAVAAAIALQRGLARSAGPAEDAARYARMFIHSGGAVTADSEPTWEVVLTHARRVLPAVPAGQILLSGAAAARVRDQLPPGLWLADLGLYRPRDGAPAERLFQVRDPEIQAATTSLPSPAREPKGHLPLRLTRFFGREAEIAVLAERLQRQRLVTLIGPGGSGKTRLAIEVAARLASRWEGAVWFVPLVDLTDGKHIAEAVRAAVPLPSSAGFDPWEQLVAALSRRPALLLLDNFEHLVEEGALLVRRLLEAVPTLTCLVTSRQHLGLEGEVEFPVEPLPVPELAAAPGPLLDYPSVQLFVDRAQAVRPDFQVTPANAATMAALCGRLEGIPLALELAAARIRALTPAQMLTHLEHRFDFLVTRRRDAEERHRTLRAALDWSYRLLPPELQRFFARLAVFRGGWTHEAAAAVGDEPRALEFLEELRACSLVQAEELEEPAAGGGGGTPREAWGGGQRSEVVMRFRMLETLREHAAEQLSSEDRAATETQHAAYFADLVQQAVKPGQSPEAWQAWEVRLEQELPNILAALRWSVVHGEVEMGLRLGEPLWLWFFTRRGYQTEARAYLAELLALEEASGRKLRRAPALLGAAVMAFHQSDYEPACALAEESLALFRERGDQAGSGLVLNLLGLIADEQGRYEVARSFYGQCLTICRAQDSNDSKGFGALQMSYLGYLAHVLGDEAAAGPLLEEGLAILRQLDHTHNIAIALNNLGLVAHARGDAVAARAFHEEALGLQRGLKDKHCGAISLAQLGKLAMDRGEDTVAHAYYRESLAWRQDLGEKRGIAECLEGLAGLALAKGRPGQAARWLGTAEATRETIGAPRTTREQTEHNARLGALRDALGEGPAARAWKRGSETSPAQAAAEALADHEAAVM